MHDTARRILAALERQRATSKRPARAADVAALVACPDAEFWPALEHLVATHQVSTAHIQRPAHDPEPWLALWPSGVHLAPNPMSGASLAAIFVPHPPMAIALRAAFAPRTRPEVR